MASKAVNNVNMVADVTNQNAVSGAGTRHESAGMIYYLFHKISNACSVDLYRVV